MQTSALPSFSSGIELHSCVVTIYVRVIVQVIDMVKEEKVMPRGRGRGGMGGKGVWWNGKGRGGMKVRGRGGMGGKGAWWNGR